MRAAGLRGGRIRIVPATQASDLPEAPDREDEMTADEGRITVLQVVANAAGTVGQRSVGGPERRAYASLEHWDYSRFRLVLTYSPEGRLSREFEQVAADNPDVTLLPVPAPGRRNWRALSQFIRIIRENGIDITHSQGPHGTDWWVALAARFAGAASVVTRPVALSHYGMPPKAFLRFRLLDRLALLATFAMVFVSEDVRAESIRIGETQPHSSLVIRNGVDLDHFHPPRVRGDHPPTFGMVGQLLPVKDWDTFLAASERIFDAVPDSRAVIIGDGPQRERIAHAIAERGWQERVEMTGFLSDVAPALARLDVFTLTSIREGLPVSIIEAMGMAKPVVATDVGGVRSIVEDGRTGYLVRPGDAAAIGDHIIRLLRDRGQREDFGAAARAAAEETLSISAMVRGYERLYREAVAAKRGLRTRVATRTDDVARV